MKKKKKKKMEIASFSYILGIFHPFGEHIVDDSPKNSCPSEVEFCFLMMIQSVYMCKHEIENPLIIVFLYIYFLDEETYWVHGFHIPRIGSTVAISDLDSVPVIEVYTIFGEFVMTFSLSIQIV